MPVRDATTALLRAITAAFHGCRIEFEHIHSRDWVSGTLSAIRHQITLCVSGEGFAAAVDAFRHGLEEREFDLGRYILADIAVTGEQRDRDGVRLTLEALTIDND